jgi:hypothetical protein
MSQRSEAVSSAILRLTAASGPGKSIAPEEAARAAAEALGVEWHSLLQEVRNTAMALAREGRVVILRKGKPADPDNFKGVYRLGAPNEG